VAQEIEIEEESTVEDVLDEAKLDSARHTLMVNGSQAEPGQMVGPNDVVTLAPNVQGADYRRRRDIVTPGRPIRDGRALSFETPELPAFNTRRRIAV